MPLKWKWTHKNDIDQQLIKNGLKSILKTLFLQEHGTCGLCVSRLMPYHL